MLRRATALKRICDRQRVQNAVMYQIKTKSGKQGWFYTDNKVTVINNKLFEEIVYAG